MIVYGPYDPPPSNPLICEGEGRTRQSEKDACDVNKIVARYDQTGLIERDHRELIYADVSSVGDYREAVERVRRAEEMFMDIPARVRGRFSNDPAAFLDFATNPENHPEMVEMGLLPAKNEPEATIEEPEVVAEPDEV